MNRKKTIKQLMAIGVQRNDAAAFARAYRKIMDAKREDLFPEIVKPVMPVMGVVNTHNVEKFKAEYLVPEDHVSYFIENPEELANRIKDELSQGLARGLMENGAIIMQMVKIPCVGTKYSATVKVVIPSGRWN